MPHIEPPNAPAPVIAAAGLGIGIGVMLHGVLLNELLDWHRTASTWYPLTSGENIRINAVWDGVYHRLCGAERWPVLRLAKLHRYDRWSLLCVSGGLLNGIGGFNLVEEIIMHDVLVAHPVDETAPLSERFL